MKGAPRLAGAVVVGVALLAIAAFAAWQATKEPDTAAEPASVATAAVVRDTADRATLLPANPADSLSAAGFAVEIMSANTRDGANFELRRNRERFPAATLTPVAVGEARATWFKIIVGAYPDLRTADSLLRAARDRGIVGDSAGLVLRAPLALLVDSAASGAEGLQAVERHSGRGLPAYALLQRDGRALVYVGAFTRPEEAALFATELAATGTRPVLVYRTGRVF